MYQGLILTLSETSRTDGRLAKVIAALANYRLDFSVYHHYGEHVRGECSWVVRAKYSWQDFIHSVHVAYGYGELNDWEQIASMPNLCGKNGCFEETADSCYVNVQGLLFDRHGEAPYEVHEHCKQHLSLTARAILAELETVDLTPEEKQYKDRAFTWRLRSHWYAQATHDYQDGDYETGYFDCTESSAWLGPFVSRDEALGAAKAYDDFYC